MRSLAFGLLLFLAIPLQSTVAQDDDAAVEEKVAQEDLTTQIGRYQISEVSGSFMLLDTATGNTWLLSQTDNKQVPAVWVPIPQFDESKDAPEMTRKPRLARPPATLAAHQSLIADLKRRVAELGIEEKQLAQTLGIDHPRRHQIREQINAIEAQSAEETQKMLNSIDEQIVVLRMKLEDLSTKFGPEHPEVKELQRQIDHWKEFLVVLEIEY